MKRHLPEPHGEPSTKRRSVNHPTFVKWRAELDKDYTIRCPGWILRKFYGQPNLINDQPKLNMVGQNVHAILFLALGPNAFSGVLVCVYVFV